MEAGLDMLHLTRKQFLDRPMSTAELRALGEMWRGWSGIPHGTRPGGWGEYRLGCRISGFARQDADRVRAELEAHLAGFDGQIESIDEDTLQVLGPMLSASQPFDVGLWAELLSAPTCAGMCLMLRLHIHGSADVGTGRGTPESTLVLFGLSLRGGFCAKALWVAASGEQTEDIYHRAAWPDEKLLLNALEVFRHVESLPPSIAEVPLSFRCCDAAEAAAVISALRTLVDRSVPIGANEEVVWAHASSTACAQAASHARFFRSTKNPLFLTKREARLAGWMTRMWAELPRDRSPGRFAVRLGIPLGVSAALVWAIASIDPAQVVARATLAVPAVAALLLAVRIIVKKIRLIARVRRAMHEALTKLYSHPSSMEPVDLRSVGLEDDPSVPKYSREMELAGGRHMGDFRVISEAAPGNAFRKYLLTNERTVVSVIFMNRAKRVSLFPARPLVSCKTRFRDGHRHATLTGKGDRKLRMPDWTATCLRQATLDDVLATHRAAVRKLMAEGREPLDPPWNPAGLIALERAETEESWAFYQSRCPYTWGDAVHWAFNRTRREYRPVAPLPSRERSDDDEE